MPAPTYTWNTITAAQCDYDSPINETLMEGIRQNIIHLEEWLGDGYTAAKDHDHDGANSKPVTALGAGSVNQTAIADAAVGQGELKTTTGEVSGTQTASTNLTLPGGTYGFYPQVKATTSAALRATLAGVIDVTSTSYVTNINIISTANGYPVYAQQRYIQASPPYRIGDKVWGHFLFLLRKISDGGVVASYEAEDPPWAYNGAVWLPKDDAGRLSEVPHPFADYWQKDPAVDGLEIVMVDLTAHNTKAWKQDNAKVGKGILEDLGSVITGKGKAKQHADYLLPAIPRFTDKVKIITP